MYNVRFNEVLRCTLRGKGPEMEKLFPCEVAAVRAIKVYREIFSRKGFINGYLGK